MKAIILAAGKGSRLYPLTLDKPKGLLPLGESTLLDRLVDQFKKLGIQEILLVVGFQKEIFKTHFKESVRYREYADFETTNNLHTLWSIRDELTDDVLISFADLVVEDSILKELIDTKSDLSFVIDTSQVLEMTMRVESNEGRLKSITRTAPEVATGNFIGISKLSKLGSKKLVDEMSGMIKAHQNDYYTIAVDNLIQKGITVDALDIAGKKWCEIDTKAEYDELLSQYETRWKL